MHAVNAGREIGPISIIGYKDDADSYSLKLPSSVPPGFRGGSSPPLLPNNRTETAFLVTIL